MNKHNLRSVQLASDLILIEIIPKLFLGHNELLSHIKREKSHPIKEKVSCICFHGNEFMHSQICLASYPPLILMELFNLSDRTI